MTIGKCAGRPVIRDARGWNAQSHHMKELFGLDPKAKWPKGGIPARYIQGIKVYVLSLEDAKHHKLFHRVRAICPLCKKELSAGRLHQHTC